MPIINLVYEAPENSGWQPWVNTLAYWRFNNDLTDEMGNMTASWSYVSYWTIGTNHYVQNTSSGFNWAIAVTWDWLAEIGSWDWAVSMYVYVPTTSSTRQPYLFGEWYDGASPRPWITVRYFWNTRKFHVETADWVKASTSSAYSQEARYNVVATRVSWTVYLYVNWELAITPYTYTYDYSTGSSHTFFLMNRTWWIEWTWGVSGARLSEVIYEKQGWSSQNVIAYFNQTKSIYWIS